MESKQLPVEGAALALALLDAGFGAARGLAAASSVLAPPEKAAFMTSLYWPRCQDNPK